MMSNEKELVPYSEFTEQLETLRDKADHLADVSTDEGYKAAKRIHLDFRKIENALDTERKKQKKYWSDGAKSVDEQAKSIMNQIAGYRLPHTEAYQEKDKAEREREASRIADLEKRLDYIVSLPSYLGQSSSEEVKLAMEEMQAEKCLKFYEYTARALEARNATRESLGQLYANKLQQEKDAAELAEFKRKQDEQVIADKVGAGIAEAMAENVAPVHKVNPVKASSMDEYREHQREVNTEVARGIVDASGIDMATAKAIVRSIARNQISSITINY